MPLIQGGHPETIWERTPDPLKWEINSSHDLEGQTVYELKLNCGLEIIRLQFFTEEEMGELQSVIFRNVGREEIASNGG
jgi:hypothetical protein